MEKRCHATLLLPFVLLIRALRITPGILFYLILILTPSLFYGQTLDEFKTAAGSTGVQSIPYSSPRGDGAAIQRDIDSRKEELRAFKDWKEYDRAKIENYKKIRLENEIIKKRKDYIAELKSRNVDASQFEKEVDENFKNVKSYEDNVVDINNEVSKAADVWDKLTRLRGGQREKFNDVLSKLSSSKSSPSTHLPSSPTEEDKKQLFEYIDTITAHIQSEAVKHAVEETNDKNAKQNMDNVLKRTSE